MSGGSAFNQSYRSGLAQTMDSTWDPDWDSIGEPLSLSRRPEHPARLRNRTRSEPSLKKLIPDRLLNQSQRLESTFTGEQLNYLKTKSYRFSHVGK